MPATLSAAIAKKAAATGASASQAPQAESLPFLSQAIKLAFTNTLHGTFLIPAILLLVTALLVAFTLRQPAKKVSIEAASSPETTEALTIQGLGEEGIAR